jgi:UDP-N-acetylglucosamine--N-acetylmuramyl-(pentapeptide) pyrophosphoryl-undecaprenol N-acetylglucosamine transferase
MLMRIPRVLQEQNSVPGLVNRRLARFADLVLLGYEESRAWLPRATHALVVGNPIRRMPRPSREEAAAFFSLDASRTTVCVVGGSRGAHSLNVAGAEAAARLAQERGVQFVILSGARDRAEVERKTAHVAERVRVIEYLDAVHFAYAFADLAVARAGASSVFELAAFGVPTIFVPYPFAADAHQDANAAPVVRAGGAVSIPDSDLAGERLVAEMLPLLDAPARLGAMARAMRAWSKPDAAERAADAILDVVKKKEPAGAVRRAA